MNCTSLYLLSFLLTFRNKKLNSFYLKTLAIINYVTNYIILFWANMTFPFSTVPYRGVFLTETPFSFFSPILAVYRINVKVK